MKLILSALLMLTATTAFSSDKIKVKNQTVVGTIQGLGYKDSSAVIEIGTNGRGTRVNLGSTTHLQDLGLKKNLLVMGDKVEATGKLTKGKVQDEMDAELLVVNGRTFKLK